MHIESEGKYIGNIFYNTKPEFTEEQLIDEVLYHFPELTCRKFSCRLTSYELKK